MFRKVNIPILGVVENMSYFLCPSCGQRSDIFGSGGARARAAQLGVPFLGEIPLNIQIRILGDEGNTAGVLGSDSSGPYLQAICQQLEKNIAGERKQASSLPAL
jgi:ATP-binding protein involved in chromosome partitioning